MKKILFISCWWTIDKDYNTCKWSYDFVIWKSRIHDITWNKSLNIEIKVIEHIRKDSLDMDDEDRKNILDIIENSDTENVIITHWTDTMVETWKVLQKIQDKRIILVWSSLPYVFKNSDAEFNIWFAIWTINILDDFWKNWVYVCMSWECFDVDNVQKNEDWRFSRVR